MRYRIGMAAIVVLAGIAGCAEERTNPVAPGPELASPSLSNAAAGDGEDFSFMPPLGPEPQPGGVLDKTLLEHLRVDVCRIEADPCAGEAVASFSATTDKGGLSADPPRSRRRALYRELAHGPVRR